MIDWQTMPPLSALRAFSVLAETGSVVTAADRLGVTHAAVSQQIRNLEKTLDLALVARSGRGIELTDEGRHLAEGLRQGFDELARIVRDVTAAQDERALHLTTTPMFASAWLVPRLGRFRASHPKADLVLDPSPALRKLEPGGYDAAIRHGTGYWPGLDAALLLPVSLVVVGAPSILQGHDLSDPETLTQLPWLSELGHNEALEFLTRQGVPKPRRGGMVHLPGDLMLDAARAGQGLAVVTEGLVADDLQLGRLQVVLRDNTPRGYYLLTRPGIQRPPLRAFVRWVQREAAAAPALSHAARPV